MDAKRLRVGDIEMAYEEAGSGERPFVLVHGFTGSRDDFSDVLPELGELGHTVILDQRGHGDSTNTRDRSTYHFAQLQEDLLGFLDAMGIERCNLLGHSMGGVVSLRFALDHPERVASLVLMDTTPGPIAVLPKGLVAAGALLGRVFGMGLLYRGARRRARREGTRAPSMRRCEERMGSERYWRRVQRKLEAMDPVAFGALGVQLSDHEPVNGRLAEIRVPTLVVVGAEDVPFLRPSREVAEGIGGAAHEIVPDAAHSPQLENRDVWLAAIRAHLRRARA
jgi:pimeloyl-ACP methyl ester carboxylesterase